MPRLVHRLTERSTRHIEAPGYHPDGAGLYLQVSRSGTRSWVYRFTLNGRTRDRGLGPLATVSLAEARGRAVECRKMVERGVDPIEAAKQPQASPEPLEAVLPTFEEFARDYVAARESSWRSAKHGAQWLATLVKYAFPVIGHLRPDMVDTAAVLRVIEPIWTSRPETASRVRGRIERILAAMAVRGLRPATNPAAWRGHLKEALPPRRAGGSFAALHYTAVPGFVSALQGKAGMGALALQFAILTAARSGEVRGARWSEIDEAARTWTVPADRMKSGRSHVVPLSREALAVIESVLPAADLFGEFLFPGIYVGRPLSDMTLSKLVHDMGFDVTVHGFRASFKSWAEDETGHANVVIEAALAHIVGDKAEQSYMRGDRLAKRRALLDDWGAYCRASPRATVVPFERREAS